jgi:hypothetical protein
MYDPKAFQLPENQFEELKEEHHESDLQEVAITRQVTPVGSKKQPLIKF